MLPIGDVASSGYWRQLANQGRFFAAESHAATQPVQPNLFILPLGCALWMNEG
jgi:hypothetical protein